MNLFIIYGILKKTQLYLYLRMREIKDFAFKHVWTWNVGGSGVTWREEPNSWWQLGRKSRP